MKNAIISVSSTQGDESGDAVEVVTPGNYYEKNGSFFAVYKETEISGMQGTTTTIKIGKDNFSLIRMGSTSTNMEFKNNKENMALYNTPYGTLQFKIETRELDININEDGGNISVNYDLSVEGQKSQSTNLKINIKVN